MQAFVQADIDRFVKRLEHDVRRDLPDRTVNIDVEDFIRYGIQRCQHYSMYSEQSIERYVRIMLLFGRDFDTDPCYPWAASSLNDNSHSEITRINHLSQAAYRWVQTGHHG
jgi:hypothetical protein